MSNLWGILLSWLNTASMGPTKGALGKTGELVEALEGALPPKWRSRKLYVAAVVVALVQFAGLTPKWELLGDLLGAGLFVVPEAVKEIVAAWRGGPSGYTEAYKGLSTTSRRME